MSFSVLIAVYFKEDPVNFKAALESIINQTIRPDEIVLVKDGRLTEELNEVISILLLQNPNLFQIIELEHNQGLGKALEIGLSKCSFELVARMDSDDISLPFRFERQLKYFAENPNLSVLGSHIDEFNIDPNTISGTRKVPLNHDQIYQFGKKRNPVNHVTVMFKKSDVMASGNYVPFLFQEDYYLWVRMLLKGYIFANTDESLVLVRGGETMQERRGGGNYLQNELRFHFKLFKMTYINFFQMFFNILVRIVFRLGGRTLRTYLYKSKLRN